MDRGRVIALSRQLTGRYGDNDQLAIFGSCTFWSFDNPRGVPRFATASEFLYSTLAIPSNWMANFLDR